ncbi:MAG: flavoprotein [Pirellulaceae bacterium]
MNNVNRPIVLAITGASGATYAARLLQLLMLSHREVHVVVSASGAAVIQQELGVPMQLARIPRTALRVVVHVDQEANDAFLSTGIGIDAVDAGIGNGNLHVHHVRMTTLRQLPAALLTGGMVICPCSGEVRSMAWRVLPAQSLIQRSRSALKRHRKLIIVPRETPLSVLQLENMHRLASAGVVVLPAAPGWYHGVTNLLNLVDFVVARILDQLDIDNAIMRRWTK